MSKLINFIVFMNLISSCHPKPEPETYLIQKGFKGQVNIIFNQSNGVQPKYEDNSRIYEIPPDGVLLTQFKDEYGWVDRRYYYIDSNGKRTPLKIFEDKIFSDSTSTADRNEVGIFSDGTTGVYGNSSDPKSLRYQYFCVSDYNGLDSFFTKEYKKSFDKKIEGITKLKQ